MSANDAKQDAPENHRGHAAAKPAAADGQAQAAAHPAGAATSPHNMDDGITVRDRRHGARAAEAPAAQGEAQAADEDTAPPPSVAPETLLLQQKLAHSESRLAATLAQYKDALDEFAGAKARLKRDVGKEVAAGKRKIFGELLDVVDNLERAMDTTQEPKVASSAFYQGISMVRAQFLQKLEAMGVTRLPALGQPFDPTHFEAISTVPVTDAKQDGVVMGVVRDGYLLDGETLRHGMVAVGKHSA